MPFGVPANPQLRSAVFRTSNVEMFRDEVLTGVGATNAEVSGTDAFEAHGQLIELQDMVLLSASSTSSIAVDYPEFDFVRLTIPLAGRGVFDMGGETIEVNEHQSCVTSPGRSTRVKCSEDHKWINLRVKSEAVTKRLTSLLGSKPKRFPQFAPVSSLDHPRSKSLSALMMFFGQQLNSGIGGLPSLVLQELEQALVTAFLLANRHTFSDHLEQDGQQCTPWQVRRAEEYIESHWNQAISIDVLVGVTGTNARSLHRAFMRGRGYSPMSFAKRVRLRHARELLAAPDERTTVIGVALKCGFANVGHFAKDYRGAFGELPSHSLARSRIVTGLF
jgi:AraC-like DNA-binding protein